ncbi:MAG: hypothetical protein E7643_08850 [Ruminococcaceae bacterium]|nr:hypothetical protein [Oscillospiraceae bacterium]
MSVDEKKERYTQLLEKNKRLKKKMVTALAVLLCVVLLLIGILLVLYFVTLPPEEETEAPDIEFSPTYDGNIFEFDEYLAYDRNVYYFDGRVRISVDGEHMENYDGNVRFLYAFLESMTKGDAKTYNACFTEPAGVSSFSQQMIYEAEIGYLGNTLEQDGDRVYTYSLKYKIHRNDGSLRRDVGSDVMIPQYVVLRATPEGRISIDRLYTESDG